MKKSILFLLVFLLGCHPAFASILPATGVDENFKAWTGIECTPAVVLCESLSILDARGDQGGKKVDSLLYTGNDVPVIESWDGYAKIYYSDGTRTGWVNNEYLMFNPAWYVCDEDTQVYAYPDAMAPRVAYLEKGTKLPILTEYQDDSVCGWVCISLRAAAGWIRKTPLDTVSQTSFQPEMLGNILSARLVYEDGSIELKTPAVLQELASLLTHVEDHGSMIAGCPFTADLFVCLSDGTELTLKLATDSCSVYRVNERDYSYARNLWTEEGSPSNDVLFSLFGISPEIFWK